ncbi:MAG: hypothetical protein H6651_07170 [Ardenticatenales bacterium]|nr:hypothetical protein [Ardenticatenales bacterium]
MRLAKSLRFLLIPALLLAILSPLVAAASPAPAGANHTLQAGDDSLAQDEPEAASEGVGAAVALSLIAFILLLVAVVAVIGATGLGIIGLGYWQSSGSD